MGVKCLRRVTTTGSATCVSKYGQCIGELVMCCNDLPRCVGACFHIITPAEFNASIGIKWRVKKDGRVLPYEDDYAEVIIIMDDRK